MLYSLKVQRPGEVFMHITTFYSSFATTIKTEEAAVFTVHSLELFFLLPCQIIHVNLIIKSIYAIIIVVIS